MHDYYAKLNIPNKEKLIHAELFDNEEYKCTYRMYGPQYLSEYGKEFFKTHNLNVKYIIHFSPQRSIGDHSNQVLHTDNRVINGVKEPIICGINFELVTPVEAEFCWCDTSALSGYLADFDYIDSSDFEKEIRMRADVYDTYGITEGVKVLERLRYDNDAYLFRTELPHIVFYNSHGVARQSVSIRFEQEWNSWEECYERFKSLMIE